MQTIIVIKARHLMLLAALAILGRAALSFADNVTMTTYYPSPYGVYDRLRTRSDAFFAVSGGSVGIGTASVGAGVKLRVAGSVQIEDGTQSAGRVLTSDAFGRATWQAGSIPAGAVLFFNAPACPAGWSEMISARGRYLVGLPNAGALAGTAGSALSNLENRPVGQHSHGVNDPGHRHTYTPPVYTSTGSGGSKAGVGGPVNTSVNPTGVTINPTGAVVGTNAPYIQLLVCQKN